MRLRFVTVFLLAAVALAGACAPAETTPAALVEGRTVYGKVCSACHGAAGRGGVGPALDTVAVDWPSCTDHIEWVTIGSDGWREAHGDTYGATAKPIKGGMPAQGSVLSAREIAAVAAFERVQYGRLDAAAVLADCGLSGD